MKTVKEIAIRLENKPGALARISELLSANGIGIQALTVRPDGATGTIHFIASDPSRVVNVLESAGLSVEVHEVLAAELPHHPGAFHTLLKILSVAGVNIEYLYAWTGSPGPAESTILLLGVDDLPKAHAALAGEWVQLYGEELYTF